MRELFSERRKLVTRISQTPRGAMFKLRQAVYSVIRGNGLDVEISRRNWRKAAEKMIASLSGVSSPTRLELIYELEHSEGKLIFKPISYRVEIYEKSKELSGEL